MVAIPRTMQAIRLHGPGVDGLRRETIATPSLQLHQHAAGARKDDMCRDPLRLRHG